MIIGYGNGTRSQADVTLSFHEKLLDVPPISEGKIEIQLHEIFTPG